MGVDPTVSRPEIGSNHKGRKAVLNVKAVVAAFNKEKALVGAFSWLCETSHH